MGTTKTALDAGSTAFVYICAVEGYEKLLTNAATTAAAVTAWAAAADYTTATGGLFVSLDADQSLNPYEPFGAGGSCQLTVIPTPGDDTFGVATHRKSAGNSTELAVTLDRNDTTVTVKSTTAFDSSGTIYIGTEAISYSGKTSTTFTGCTRGKYSPFAATGSETLRFGQHHRVGIESDVKLNPVVSSQPRSWIGRRVGVWMHRVVAGVLDVKAQAHLVWSGKIVEIRDDVNSFGTVMDVSHELDALKDATLGRQMWKAKTKPGVYLRASDIFRMEDNSNLSGGTKKVSNEMTVTAGYYSVADLHSAINSWLAAETAASRIYGTYNIDIAETANGWRTWLEWRIPHASITTTKFYFIMPTNVAKFLGYGQAPAYGPGNDYTSRLTGSDQDDEWHSTYGNQPALVSQLFKFISGQDGLAFELIDEEGTFVNQLESMPAGLLPSNPLDHATWGVLLFDDKVLMRGAYETGTVNTLEDCYGAQQNYNNAFTADLESYDVPYDGITDGSLAVKQILMFEDSFATFLKSVAYSTGVEGYNHADYDSFPFGCGANIPGSLLGYNFETSVDAVPGADESIVVILDKPTKLIDLIQGDMIFRRAFPLWKDQGLRFGAWRSPSPGAAVATLAESNKAAPAGNVDNHRTSTTQTNEWLRPIVKVLYNRDFTDLSSDGFRSSLTIEDSTSIDDMGGDAALVTIKAMNTYGDFEATGAGIKALAPNFVATMPMFSRPARKLTRSIDPRYFHSISIGDVVLFTDAFARDPATGTRGITAWPALITKHRWNPGGKSPGSDKANDAAGEVELFFTDKNATLSNGLYAPAADIDDTVSTGGFDAGYASGTSTIRCYAQRYTQTTEYEINGSPVLVEENADATFFAAGYKVRIIERDPVDPLAPVMWERTVISQSGNDIVFTVALSSPAWDNTKKYRITFDDYDVAVTAQQLKVYQADDADGLILDASGPFLYGNGSSDLNYETNVASADVELVPDIVIVDGAGRDVGHEHALIKQLDNFIDYKSAIQTPKLWNAPRSNTLYGGSYLLVAMIPLYLSLESLSSAVLRELNVGIQHRSTSGYTSTVRVTLARAKPSGLTLIDVNRGATYSQMTRSTASTTWQTSSTSALDARVKVPATGLAWLLVECSYYASCRGIHQLSESIRTTEFVGI